LSWLTLRELDQAQGAAKGAAFRAFKALESQLSAPRDFRLLDAARDAVEIAALGSRRYRSSRNVLLFSPETAALLREKMR
jgi:hypothetical protein